MARIAGRSSTGRRISLILSRPTPTIAASPRCAAANCSADRSAAVADAEAALVRARRRLADLSVIEEELSAERAPGRSIPNIKVEEAVRAVVKAHPTVRRLVEDWQNAERTFRVYEATLIWLAGQQCVPGDLVSVAPSRNAIRYADPDPAWVDAIDAMRRDADSALPE
jgi:hypothetical protein